MNITKTVNKNKVDYAFRDAKVGDKRLHDERFIGYWAEYSRQKKIRETESNEAVLKQLKIMNVKGPLILFIIFKNIKVE